MTVPEAAVNKKSDFPAGEQQVWAARKVPAMQPEPVAEPVRDFPYRNFRFCFLSPDPAHDL